MSDESVLIERAIAWIKDNSSPEFVYGKQPPNLPLIFYDGTNATRLIDILEGRVKPNE